MSRRALVAIAVTAAVCLFVAVIVAAVGFNAQSTGTSAACRAANVVQGEIRGVLERQKQGLPANSYFKSHPDQLVAAQKSVADELKTFAPFQC